MSILQKKCLNQCGLSITLFLWSIQMDCVISELYYKGTILQRNYSKMTMIGDFPIIPL